MFRVINELIGITLALVSGIYAFQYMNLASKLFFLQLITYIIVYILSFVVQHIPSMQHHNHWIYNLYMPIETGLLTWGGYEYFKSTREKFLVWIGYFIFLGILISEIIIKGLFVLSNHGYIAEGILMVVLYLSVIYMQLTSQNNTWKRSPEFWISLGIVLYFGGDIPYLSLMDYLQQYYPKINLYLYRFINIGLSNLRYLFLAIAFWLIRQNAIAKTPIVNE